MAAKLYTIGYEGMTLESFVERLKLFAIDCLIDVRELPLSRKRGFSKSGLAKRLSEENIDYVHIRDLGSPKTLRSRLRENKDYPGFFKKMAKHLAQKTHAIADAYKYVTENTCCLMCFEQLAEQCHRKLVAKKIKQMDENRLQVSNI